MCNRETYADTRASFSKLLQDTFNDMLYQLQKDGKCSGDYENSKWPVEERLNMGQDRLSEHLDDLHDFLTTYSKKVNSDELFKFLTSQKVAYLRKELKRAELPETNMDQKKKKKSECVDALYDYAISEKGGYQPTGYTGDIPTERADI